MGASNCLWPFERPDKKQGHPMVWQLKAIACQLVTGKNAQLQEDVIIKIRCLLNKLVPGIVSICLNYLQIKRFY